MRDSKRTGVTVPLTITSFVVFALAASVPERAIAQSLAQRHSSAHESYVSTEYERLVASARGVVGMRSRASGVARLEAVAALYP